MEASNSDQIKSDIFTLLNLHDSSDEEKGEIFAKILEVIQLRVIKRIGDELSQEDVQKFDELIEQDSPDAEEFLQEKISNYDEIFKEEAEKYKNELILKTREE